MQGTKEIKRNVVTGIPAAGCLQVDVRILTFLVSVCVCVCVYVTFATHV